MSIGDPTSVTYMWLGDEKSNTEQKLVARVTTGGTINESIIELSLTMPVFMFPPVVAVLSGIKIVYISIGNFSYEFVSCSPRVNKTQK